MKLSMNEATALKCKGTTLEQDSARSTAMT